MGQPPRVEWLDRLRAQHEIQRQPARQAEQEQRARIRLPPLLRGTVDEKNPIRDPLDRSEDRRKRDALPRQTLSTAPPSSGVSAVSTATSATIWIQPVTVIPAAARSTSVTSSGTGSLATPAYAGLHPARFCQWLRSRRP